jgi:hypothetical protein
VISKIPHTFGSYEVKVAPTCTDVGYAYPKCSVCGYVDKTPDELDPTYANPTDLPTINEGQFVRLAKIPHNFTDWKIVKDPTCAKEGEGERACIWCGMAQHINIDNYTSFDSAAQKWFKNNLGKLNAAWDGTLAPIKAGKVKYEIIKDWDFTCYERELTYQCPYCKGKVHADVKETLDIIAHIWKSTPEPFGETTEFGDAPYSKAPTCTEKGWYLYKCIYDDGAADSTWTKKHEDEDVTTRYKKVEIPATGHNWGEWKVANEYKKDGKDYQLLVRYCKNCNKPENQVVEKEGASKNGLTYEEGEWRYYENGSWNKAFSGIVDYDGGKFFVADGVLCSGANGLQLYKDTWYYLSNGQIHTEYTGLAEHDGAWFYVTNGIMDAGKNGLVDYDGSKFLVAAGKIRYDVNGLWQDFDGSWYYLSNGQVQTSYTGLVCYDGAWFYVVNGKLDTSFNGTVKYDGADFKVVGGQVVA